MKINISNSGIFLTVLVITMFGIISLSQAQTVTQPLAGVSTSAKVYTYTHMLSQTQKKDIRYIIIKASNGDVKSCFDACDVSYLANKGYVQSGNLLRCNNCGNTFAIDGLGSQGVGGCWPGHLPHTLDAQNVIFTVSDLITGDKYYPTKAVTAVQDEPVREMALSFNWFIKSDLLTVSMDNASERNISIFNISGKICKTLAFSSNQITVDISDLSVGVYLLSVEENGRTTSQTIVINR
jgi:hypothetical protein